MKKILKILFFLLCLGFESAVAQKITLSFSDVSLSEALKEIDLSQKKVHVQFMYNELEDFRVSIRVENKSVEDAVRAVCGYYPVSIRKNGGTIFVECLQKARQKYTGSVIGSTTSLQRPQEKENLGPLQDMPLTGANVTLLHPVDSMPMVQGVSNEEGFFVVPCDEPEAIVRISHVGYETYYKHCKGGEVGQVRMKPSVKNIPEITIGQEAMHLPVVKLDKPGSLSSILSPEQQDTLTMLSLMGKVNSADIRTLRHMAGYEEDGCRTGKLKWLDLREVEFVTDKMSYLILDATEEKMMGFAKGKYSDQSGGPRYWPYYVLNSPPNEDSLAVGRVNLLAKVWTDKQTGISLANSPFMSSSKVSFDFRIRFSKVDRMWMHRYEMKKFDGHRMKWNGERYEYIACTHKGIFFLDMFYKCPQMKTIVLSENVKISENVSVFEDPITYSMVKIKQDEK